jgi:hypothetical protein
MPSHLSSKSLTLLTLFFVGCGGGSSNDEAVQTEASSLEGGTHELGVDAGAGHDAHHDANSVDADAAKVTFTPKAGVTFNGRSVTQYGITWTFAENATYGQFANGDYWVIGPVQITSISPDKVTTGGRTMNGWDVNPMPSSPQGYDSCGGDYDASDVPALPYTAKPGSSIVKTVGLATPGYGAGHPVCVQTAAVLTVVDKAPPDNGASVFRPAYVGPKTVPMNYVSLSTVQWGLLPTLTPNTAVSHFAPTFASIMGKLNRVQLDHLNGYHLNVKTPAYTGVPNATINPVDNMECYGPDIALENNDAILRLFLNDPLEAKVPTAVAMIQGGIDRYVAFQNGQFWPAGSGMHEGRKISLAFASVMLGDAAMQAAVTTPSSTGGSDFYLEDSSIGVGFQGMPLYGSRLPNAGPCGGSTHACTYPDYAFYWSFEQGGAANAGSSDPYGYVDGSMNSTDESDGYMPINGPSFSGSALVGMLVPEVEKVWGHPEFFAYVDRYMMQGIYSEPDPCLNAAAGGGPDPKNPGGCILDPNLTPGSTMQNFSCKSGKTCGRWPQYNARFLNGGPYESAFTNAMWEAYRNQSSARVFVHVSGVGQGTVTSSPPGISCSPTWTNTTSGFVAGGQLDCWASFPAKTVVKLSATPAKGSTFTGWSGGCSGAGPCTVTLDPVTTELPLTSMCGGYPAGIICSAPPTANVVVTGSFE